MRNVENRTTPASLGIRYEPTDGEAGSVIELAVLRGTSTILFGMRSDTAGQWGTFPLVAPERFGPTPTNYTELVAYAQAFENWTAADQAGWSAR